jgi:hypothetical protein
MPAIHLAADRNNLDELKQLVLSGDADINEKDSDEWTALHWAAWNGHLPMVQWMVEEGGADVTARERSGYTPLLHAVMYGRVDITSYLLHKGGADIADTLNDGRTVWNRFKFTCEHFGGTPQQKADLYSILRCFGSPVPDSDTFIASIENPRGYFTPAHREMLVQTERAHSHPLLLRYRAHRLDLLCRERDGGSDCTRILIPDLQNIVLEYLLSCDSLVQYLSAEELLAEAVVAEAQAAEEWGRERGMRMVRQRRE